MAVTVSKVANAYKTYVREEASGKARFKLAIASPDKTIISKKSFEYESNLTQILADYASAKNGETIEGYKFEKGVKYKINGHQFRANYTEVVIKVSNIVAFADDTRFAKFLNEESRECHDRNSRDKHVNEMVNSMTVARAHTPIGDGEDA